MSNEKARVVIVGAGILGSAVAYALTSKGEKDVLVLESEAKYDQHSTGRSAAYYIPMYESVAYAILAKASLSFLQNPPDGFCRVPIFRRDGAVIAAKIGAGATVESEITEARGLGLDVTKLDGTGIKELVPAVHVEQIEVAAYYPDAGEIDVQALTSSYRGRAEQLGARFYTDRSYRGARSQGGRIVSAMTDSGEIPCEAIVNAAGAWISEVATASGATILAPLVLRRHLLKVRVANVSKSARWPFFRCPSLPLFFKLGDGELVFSPMDAVPTPIGPCVLDPEKVEAAISTINAFTNLNVDPHEVRAVAGHRVFGPDHQPLIGPDPQLQGFFWAAAMGGTGIMAAPAVGEMVSAAILGLPPPADTTLSGLERLKGKAHHGH